MISLVKYVVIPAIKNNYGIYSLFPCLSGGMPPDKQGKLYIPCCQFLCIRSYEFLCSLIYRLHIDKTTDFNFEIIITFINLKLKLGLSYEKIKDYDSALAVYSE